MLSRYLFCLLLLLPAATYASNAVDLEATMKSMGLALKQAREAANPDAAKPYIVELTRLTTQAKTAKFPDDKAESFVAGLDKVLLSLSRAAAAAEAGDELQLKEALAEVNDLRKQYHKQRKVSFWQILFG